MCEQALCQSTYLKKEATEAFLSNSFFPLFLMAGEFYQYIGSRTADGLFGNGL